MRPVLAPMGDSPYVDRMYCAHCGHIRDGDTAVCQACGNPSLQEMPEVAAPPSEVARPLWEIRHVAAAIVLLFAGLILAALVGGFVSGAVFGDGANSTALANWIAVHLVALVVAGLVLGFGAWRAPSPLLALGLGPPRTQSGLTVLFTLAALAASLGFTIVYGLLVRATGPDQLVPPEVDEGLLFGGVGIVLSLEALVGVTPLAEEVFFRGFVVGGLLPRLGHVWAIVLSSLVFAAFHVEPGVMIPIFVTGAVFACLYWRTRSIWPCIAAHAGQNALAILGATLGG